jgi:hypothetical protein
MMPASPLPAPNPFRAPRCPVESPMPVLWLGTRSPRAIIPAIGKSWIH